jgi:hypothetical protein
LKARKRRNAALEKWQESNWLESVDLQNAEVVYKVLRRSPRSRLNEQVLMLLGEYASSVSWIDAVLNKGKLEQEVVSPAEVVNALDASKNLHKELG